MVHYYLHFGTPSELPEWSQPVKKWVRALHKAHANHHYAEKGVRESFGVSHMIWDEVFGTKATPDAIGEWQNNNDDRKKEK